jgi:hypothetical protein
METLSSVGVLRATDRPQPRGIALWRRSTSTELATCARTVAAHDVRSTRSGYVRFRCCSGGVQRPQTRSVGSRRCCLRRQERTRRLRAIRVLLGRRPTSTGLATCARTVAAHDVRSTRGGGVRCGCCSGDGRRPRTRSMGCRRCYLRRQGHTGGPAGSTLPRVSPFRGRGSAGPGHIRSESCIFPGQGTALRNCGATAGRRHDLGRRPEALQDNASAKCRNSSDANIQDHAAIAGVQGHVGWSCRAA